MSRKLPHATSYSVPFLSPFFSLFILVPFACRPGGIPARNEHGERLLLYVGIIDILQSYRFKKKLEHTWKSMLHDGVRVALPFACLPLH